MQSLLSHLPRNLMRSFQGNYDLDRAINYPNLNTRLRFNFLYSPMIVFDPYIICCCFGSITLHNVKCRPTKKRTSVLAHEVTSVD